MFINGKIGMSFAQPRQQPTTRAVTAVTAATQPQPTIITSSRQRSIRPMILGQNNKKGCKSCGSG